jgi:hypothetical protein
MIRTSATKEKFDVVNEKKEVTGVVIKWIF